MKKLLAVFLCAALILGALPACAEGAPWLSPWFSVAENVLSGNVPMRGQVQMSIDMGEVEKLVQSAANQSSDALVTANPYLEASSRELLCSLSALYGATTIELRAENGGGGIRVMVGDDCLADAMIQVEKMAEGVKYALTTDLLPSFVFTLTAPNVEKTADKEGETTDANMDVQAVFASFLALSKQGDGLNIMREPLDLYNRQAEYFLNGADKVTLTAAEYETQLNGAPHAEKGSALHLLIGLLGSTDSFFDVTDGASYTFEKTAAGYIARMTYTEKDTQYQEKADGQGYDKIETECAIESVMTIGRDSIMGDTTGHADEMQNGRYTIDVSDPDLTRILVTSGAFDGWLNVSRGADAQRVSFYFDYGEVDVKCETNANNAGTAADVSVSYIDGLMTLAAKVERAEAGVCPAPDLTGKTEIVFSADENGTYRASDADMTLIKNELYTVTRPKLIDFALSKLPKGAEGLTSMLMAFAMQIGR